MAVTQRAVPNFLPRLLKKVGGLIGRGIKVNRGMTKLYLNIYMENSREVTQ